MTVWATRADQVDLRSPNPHDPARSLWNRPPQGGSGGPTSIARTAPSPEALPTSSPFLVRDTRARRDAHMGDDCGSAGAVCTRLDQVRDCPASGDQPPDGAGVPEGPAGAGPAGAVRAGGVRPVRRVRPAVRQPGCATFP